MKYYQFLMLGLLTFNTIPTLAEESETLLKANAAKPAPATTNFRLRFVNTDVSDVLQALSLKTKASIVFPSQIKKQISIDITASNPGDALKYVTAASGLTFRQIGKTFVVALPSELRQALEPFGEKVTLPLNSLPPDAAVKLLEGALPGITARPLVNQIIVIGSPEDIAQARSVLTLQDGSQHSDSPQTDVIVLQNANALQVATLLKTMYINLKAEAIGDKEKAGGAVGIAGPRTVVESAKETIRALDLKASNSEPDRVYRVYNIKHSSGAILQDFLKQSFPNIQAVVGPESYGPTQPSFQPLTSASLGSGSGGGSGGSGGGGVGGGGGVSSAGGVVQTGEKARNLVLYGRQSEIDDAFKLLDEVDLPPQQVLVEVKVVDTSPENAEQLGLQYQFGSFNFTEGQGTQNTTTTKPAGIGYFTRTPFNFNAALSALVSRREAKILASPKVQVVDNESANIFIGDTVRTRVSQSGVNGTTLQVFEFPIGIILLVRPRISPDGKITMRVHPVVSTITSLGADGLPQTSSREAETTVMVKDGETIVIGGLIRDEMIKTVQEVPLLSKLPLVGELFRYRSTNRRHSEIMVIVTPHIVGDTPNKFNAVPKKTEVFINKAGTSGKKP